MQKFTSRKFIIALCSFVLFIVLSILEANKVLVVPENVKYILGGITTTWLIVEGLLDYKAISG